MKPLQVFLNRAWLHNLDFNSLTLSFSKGWVSIAWHFFRSPTAPYLRIEALSKPVSLIIKHVWEFFSLARWDPSWRIDKNLSFGLVLKYLEKITITFQKHYHNERFFRKIEKRLLWEAGLSNRCTIFLTTQWNTRYMTECPLCAFWGCMRETRCLMPSPSGCSVSSWGRPYWETVQAVWRFSCRQRLCSQTGTDHRCQYRSGAKAAQQPWRKSLIKEGTIKAERPGVYCFYLTWSFFIYILFSCLLNSDSWLLSWTSPLPETIVVMQSALITVGCFKRCKNTEV